MPLYCDRCDDTTPNGPDDHDCVYCDNCFIRIMEDRAEQAERDLTHMEAELFQLSGNSC